MGYSGIGEDEFFEDDEKFERTDGEAKDKPGNSSRPNIGGQTSTTLEMDDSKKKDASSGGSKKNDKSKGGPKNGKKRKKKP